VPAAWGEVYHARDSRLQRDVAVKVLRAAPHDASLRARVWREAAWLHGDALLGLLRVRRVPLQRRSRHAAARLLNRKIDWTPCEGTCRGVETRCESRPLPDRGARRRFSGAVLVAYERRTHDAGRNRDAPV
jgi:hypothetical protein